MRVRKFATQGHPRYDYWTSRYALDYTVNDTLDDEGSWNSYEEEGEKRVRPESFIQSYEIQLFL